MNIIEDKTTLVLAGAFNPAILQPQWVARHVLGYAQGQDFQVNLTAPISGIGLPRFEFGGLSYSPALGGLTFFLDSTDEAKSNRAVAAAADILQELPHTPVSGVGFNFAFEVDEPGAELTSLLSSSSLLIESFPGAINVVSRRWGNKLRWDDALVTVDCETSGANVIINFNFHHSIDGARGAELLLRTEDLFGNSLVRAREAAASLANITSGES